MQIEYSLLYEELNHLIRLSMQRRAPENKKIESCFWIAWEQWEKMKDSLRGKDFPNELVEISFFKEVKPKFTHMIEFYCILSEAVLFVPKERTSALLYWTEEELRYKRFLQKHDEFIQYVESGKTYLDRQYFLREKYYQTNIWDIPIYDAELEFCSSHDGLIRRYMAKRKYDEYVSNQIRILRDLN